MAPKFEEGTRWDPAYGQHHGPKLCGGNPLGTRILRRPLWPWPVLLYFEGSKLDPLISAFQHLVQLPAAGLIFGHVATIRTSLWEDVSWQKPTRGCCVAKGC